MTYTVEIDCPPGWPRPDDLLPGVIEGTEMKLKDFELVSKFFGNFTWVVKPERVEVYKQSRDRIKNRIEALYYSGTIRYGSW